ncbi:MULTISPECIES: histidinol-phosphate transaminase [Pacificibacter]|uniref:histidinol-phosphate transaminase n=1 Tax=Pacificibacter TaxID=1042323 RepID=UPI001C09F012|nr:MULTISPECIES: histidinol-phosphate transaminase [Pacificibacter]MBU2936397.1 histidinol-phosphate transaminase [Pacificibacter marinus]MDO6616562.1 histidinol-phosphate transaminase [Pacificibacter sp. 1_MG-2023]
MSSTLPKDLIRPEVESLPTYNAGLALDRFKDIYGIDCLAKLDSNESPLGPSPRAILAMQNAAKGVGRYPDAANMALRQQVAKATSSTADHIIFGNGSEDLIGALFRTVIRPNDKVVTICPSFGLHEFGAMMFGATVTKVPFNDDWSFPIKGLCAALKDKPRVLIFSSPSNPAGPVISQDEFRQVIAATDPSTLICFDEAYVEFIEPDKQFDAMALLQNSGRPWIVLRTFSKAYGLAGVRIGYGIASDAKMITALMKTRNPFGVNALAASAASEAMADHAHLAKVVKQATVERERIAAALTAKGFTCAPSQANFVFFDTGAPADVLAEKLRTKGVLIKAWLEAPYKTWARVTMGSPAENDIFLNAL